QDGAVQIARMVGDDHAWTLGQQLRIQQPHPDPGKEKEQACGHVGDLASHGDAERQQDQHERAESHHDEDRYGVDSVEDMEDFARESLQGREHWSVGRGRGSRLSQKSNVPLSVNWFSLCNARRGSVITVTPGFGPPPHTPDTPARGRCGETGPAPCTTAYE